MSIQANPYPLRIDKELMQKIKVMAAYNGRSVNKEIEFLLREALGKFESKRGPISLPQDLSRED